MADRTSPEAHVAREHPEDSTRTEEAQHHGPAGHTAHTTETATSATVGVVAVVLGVAGVVAGIVPGFWFVALALGLIVLAIAEPVRRTGPDHAGHRMARIAVILGVVVLVLAVLNFVVTFGGFDFFTVEGDSVID